MTRLRVGPATLLIPDHVVREVETKDYSGEVHAAYETPAVVTGLNDTLLELAYRRWEGAGSITVVSRGDSNQAFDRLTHGARLGVLERGDGTDSCDVGLLRWKPAAGAQGWGNPSSATEKELDDELGGSAAALLVDAGSYDFAPRADLLGDTSPRKNWLCATFPSEDPTGPLAVYVMTRVLPILRSFGASR